jgi:pyrroline-5-carboxylate reductase
MDAPTVAFIGGGNMAGALLGGLLGRGRERPVPRVQPAAFDLEAARRDGRPRIVVVEPDAERRAVLTRDEGVTVLATADASLAAATVVVWAVKPQAFDAAAAPCRPHVSGALQVSVMAGIPSVRIAAATGSTRIVRAMPNTPALIGEGISGVYATAAVGPGDRARADRLLAPTGERVWFDDESALDAVTALSGSARVRLPAAGGDDRCRPGRRPERRRLAPPRRADARRRRAPGAAVRFVRRRAAPPGDVARRHHRGGPPRARVARPARGRHRGRSRRARPLARARRVAFASASASASAAERSGDPNPMTTLASSQPSEARIEMDAMGAGLSYIGTEPTSPWQTYLSQIDRVVPYLGPLARWSETLKRPKRALIVDVPIEMDDGSVAHFEGYRVQHNLSRGPGRAACATTRR